MDEFKNEIKTIFTLEDLKQLDAITATFNKWFPKMMEKRLLPVFIVATKPDGNFEIIFNMKRIEKHKMIKFLEQMIKDLNQGKDIIVIPN